MPHLSKVMIFWKCFHVCQIWNKLLKFSGEQEKESIIRVRWDRKCVQRITPICITRFAVWICPSRLPIVITQQASRWKWVIFGTDFSIPTSHSWWIQIVRTQKPETMNQQQNSFCLRTDSSQSHWLLKCILIRPTMAQLEVFFKVRLSLSREPFYCFIIVCSFI